MTIQPFKNAEPGTERDGGERLVGWRYWLRTYFMLNFGRERVLGYDAHVRKGGWSAFLRLPFMSIGVCWKTAQQTIDQGWVASGIKFNFGCANPRIGRMGSKALYKHSSTLAWTVEEAGAVPAN